MKHKEEQLRIWRLVNFLPNEAKRTELHDRQLKIEQTRLELKKEEAKFLETVEAELKKAKLMK
jgi:hypothetical protein